MDKYIFYKHFNGRVTRNRARPACKELGFLKNTFVSHLIYMCIDRFSIGTSDESKGRMVRSVSCLRVRFVIFHPKQTPMGTRSLVSRFHCGYPSWILSTSRCSTSRCWNHLPIKLRTSQSVNILKNPLYKRFKLSQLRNKCFTSFLDNLFLDRII